MAINFFTEETQFKLPEKTKAENMAKENSPRMNL